MNKGSTTSYKLPIWLKLFKTNFDQPEAKSLKLPHHEADVRRLVEVSFEAAVSYEEDVDDGVVDGVVVGVVYVAVLIIVVPSTQSKKKHSLIEEDEGSW